jgi:radical SAM protein with 4Fe4S-binding SPASM domain
MLKLREVLWEITLKCDKNCKYCGSKDILRDINPTLEQLLHIAHKIGSYGVDVVTLTGGEPGSLRYSDLDSVIDTLKSYGCSVRVVTNGKIFKNNNDLLEKFDIIGLSINAPADYLSPSYLPGVPYNKITMITNFGTHNFWDFDKLSEIAKSFGSWQIQLTTGEEFLLPPEGIEALREKVRNLKETKYILADNLQDEHNCSAGINACGITADGNVIPCLSERTWGEVSFQGNLFQRSLKDIWEKEFLEIRFSDCGWEKSCRKCIKYPTIKKCTPTIPLFETIPMDFQKQTPIIEPIETPTVLKVRREINSERRSSRPNALDYSGCRGNVFSYGVTKWSILAVSSYGKEVWK